MALAIVSLLLATLLVRLIVRDLLALRRLRSLEARPPQPAGPRVSLLIPARNEARVIERCVRGALSQDYPDYEVIVVDDRSTDGTRALLGQLQTRYPQLRVLHGNEPAADWKGKQFALCQGYALASGSWLLFLDADTQPGPALVNALVAYARQQGLDMLSAAPFLELGSFWERAILPAFGSLIEAVFPLEQINDPHSEVALAIGQCILISRAAYEAVGGHAAVRAEIAEDLALARRVKHAGMRLALVDGRQLISVRMYHSGREVVEGLAKNALAGVRVDPLQALRGTLRQVLLALGPLALLLAALWAGLRRWPARPRRLITGAAALTGPLAAYSWGQMYHQLFSQPRHYGLLYPLGIVAYGLIALYAAARLRLGKGVRWKDRVYRAIDDHPDA